MLAELGHCHKQEDGHFEGAHLGDDHNFGLPSQYSLYSEEEVNLSQGDLNRLYQGPNHITNIQTAVHHGRRLLRKMPSKTLRSVAMVRRDEAAFHVDYSAPTTHPPKNN